MAICRPVCNVAFCERKRAIAVRSQQRMKSRHQARRGHQDCKNRAPHMREANRAAVQLQQAEKLIRVEMISSAVDLEVVCP